MAIIPSGNNNCLSLNYSRVGWNVEYIFSTWNEVFIHKRFIVAIVY